MRLIDADKLKKQIHCEYSDDLGILEKIDEQPTAYDVEKVVEQLQATKSEISSETYCKAVYNKGLCESKNCFECCAEYLIEIVKAGKING